MHSAPVPACDPVAVEERFWNDMELARFADEKRRAGKEARQRNPRRISLPPKTIGRKAGLISELPRSWNLCHTRIPTFPGDLMSSETSVRLRRISCQPEVGAEDLAGRNLPTNEERHDWPRAGHQEWLIQVPDLNFKSGRVESRLTPPGTGGELWDNDGVISPVAGGACEERPDANSSVWAAIRRIGPTRISAQWAL